MSTAASMRSIQVLTTDAGSATAVLPAPSQPLWLSATAMSCAWRSATPGTTQAHPRSCGTFRRVIRSLPLCQCLMDRSPMRPQSYSLARGIDLIVTRTHGRGALSRFWLSSVINRLVRRAPVPVLLGIVHCVEARTYEHDANRRSVAAAHCNLGS